MESVRRKGRQSPAEDRTAQPNGGASKDAGSAAGLDADTTRPSDAAITRVVNIQIGAARPHAVPTNSAGESSLKSLSQEFMDLLALAKTTVGVPR